MGEGSFGQVFEGGISTPSGNQRVVLKRVKTRVQGAEAMSQMEHLLNVYASRVARGHCADFLGYCEVADSEATSRLTSGLWLVWKYEGSKTLAYYLRRRDTLRALATDLQVSEAAVVPTVMKQIFESLAAFHAAGLVHRDVKPLNMIFAEDVRRFKLIDLGACADLRTGTNYVPEESILDLNFCPPEQYVMPTDSPHIAKQAGLIQMAISPVLWAKHKPDRFDTWSAGIMMLQLALPAVRTDRGLRAFNTVYGPKHQYDLAAWRKAAHLPARDCAILDADDGAGWDLLQSLLAPRHIQVDDNGGVSFVNDTPFSRISAYEAIKHKFIKYGVELAMQPAVAAAAANGAGSARSSLSSSDTASRRGGKAGGAAAANGQEAASGSGQQTPGASGDPLGSALGMWRDVTGRLFDLEARIMRQTSATELQTTTVRRLKEQVESGRTDPAVLQKEEKVLNKMQARLAGLQQDFTSTANQATGIFSFFGIGGKQQQPAGPADTAADKAKSNMQAARAAEAVSSSASASTSSSPISSAADMFSSVWERLGTRLAELERQISNQASATERQSLVVRRLRAKVRAGEAEPAMLDKAERTLSRMERRLLDLDRDYLAAKQSARGALAGKAPQDLDSTRGAKQQQQRPGSREQSFPGVAEAIAAAQQALQGDSGSSAELNGSFWSRLLGTPGRSKSGSSTDGGSDGSSSSSGKEAAATAAQQQQAKGQAGQRQLQAQQKPAPASPQPKAGTASGGYMSIFGAFGGSSSTVSAAAAAPASSSSSSAPSKVAAAPKSTEAAAPPVSGSGQSQLSSPSGTRSSSAATSGSGLFGGFFGRPKQPQPQAEAQAQLKPTAAQGAGASSSGRSSSRSGSDTAAAGPGVVVPPPAAPAAVSGGDGLVEGASRVIRSSLGFTGLAAKIAGDMAAAFKADAERYLKDIEMQEAAKRQQRTLDLAFLALLREAQPPVHSSTPYEAVDERFATEARWAALADPARRRELYGKFQVAAKKVEEQAAAAAEAGFRAALRRHDVSASSRWEDFQANMPDDPALSAVQDPSRRQQLFLEAVAELQLQAALLAASQKAELEFMALLAELRDPPVTSSSTWSLVRKDVAADPRCQVLPEQRRRELFEVYTANLFEEETRRTDLAVAAAVAVEAEEVQQLQAPEFAVPTTDDAQQVTVPQIVAAAATATEAAVEAAPAAPEPAVEVAIAPEALPQEVLVAVAAEVPPPASEPADAPDAAAAAPPAAALSAGPLADDDDLSAALAGMEAALETAIKAVTSAPVPSHAVLEAGSILVAAPPPSQLHNAPGGSAGSTNGVVVVSGRKGSAASAGLDPGGVVGFDGVRLDELRREQARLRAEYEAMAQRLREMEERLKSQAQLMSAVDDDLEAAPGLPELGGKQHGGEGWQDEEEAGGLEARNGHGHGNHNGNGVAEVVSSGGTFSPARGQRWR